MFATILCFALTLFVMRCRGGGLETMPIAMAYRPVQAHGTQGFNGLLGMDFDVLLPIMVFHVGCFNNNNVSLPGGVNISVGIYNRASQLPVPGTVTWIAGGGNRVVEYATIRRLPRGVILPVGRYSMVAVGYSPTFQNLNPCSGPCSRTQGTYLCPGGGGGGGGLNITAVNFTGDARYDTVTSLAFPTSVDAGPAARYGAGTFSFVPMMCPSRTLSSSAGDGSASHSATSPNTQSNSLSTATVSISHSADSPSTSQQRSTSTSPTQWDSHSASLSSVPTLSPSRHSRTASASASASPSLFSEAPKAILTPTQSSTQHSPSLIASVSTSQSATGRISHARTTPHAKPTRTIRSGITVIIHSTRSSQSLLSSSSSNSDSKSPLLSHSRTKVVAYYIIKPSSTSPADALEAYWNDISTENGLKFTFRIEPSIRATPQREDAQCVVWASSNSTASSTTTTALLAVLQSESVSVVNRTESTVALSINGTAVLAFAASAGLTSSNVSLRLFLNQTCAGSSAAYNAAAWNTSGVSVVFYALATGAPPPPPTTAAPPPSQPAKVVVAQTITAVFGVVSDPVIAAQASRAGVSMLLVVCGVDDSPLPFYSHPFGNAFGDGMVRYYAGAVVMNTLLVFLVAVAQGVAGLLYWALWSRRRASWNEVLTFTRFPSMLAFPILFVQQPTVSAAIVTLVWGGAEYAYAGVVGILVSAAPFALVYWWVVRAPRFGGTYVAEDPKKMRSNTASKFFFGTGMWHDVPGRPGFKQQSQFFFTDYVGGRHYFMLVEMGMNVACGIVVGLVAPSMCRSLLFVTAVLYTVFGAVGVVLRPFSSGFQLWYFVVVTCMQILGTAFSLAAVQFEVGEALDWAVKTNVATMYCLMAQVAIGLWPKQRRLRHFIAKLRRTLAAGYEETKEALLVEEMELLTEKVSGGSVDLLHCGKKHMGGDYSPPSAEDVELNIEHNHDSIVVTLEPEQQEPEQESPRVVADSFASEERLFLASSSLLATTGVQFANAEAALAALHSKEARIRELAQKVAAFITHQYSPGGAADADDGFVSAEQEKASVVSHSSILNVCLERLSLSGIWEEEESGSELMSFNDTFRFGMMSLARSGCFEATALCTLLFDGNVTERSTTPCVVTVHTQQPLEVEVSSSEGRSIIVAGEERNSRGRSPPLLLALEL